MLLDGESLDEHGGMTAYVPVHMAQGARRRTAARRRDVVTGGMRLRRDGGHPAGDPPAAMRQRPTGRRCGSGGPGRTRLRRSSGKDCCAQKCTHLSLTGTGAGSHRGEHERAAVHREGPQVGEGPESGGALRGLRRSRFAWNALCGPSQRRLARDLDVAESEVRRMLNPEHSTKAATIDRALRRLGKRVTVTVGEAA